ncbi:MAG: LEA type 2 family protein [Deinococcales bacterium]|nr:LEA type 2 family protein [Deinococcales bacterium]
MARLLLLPLALLLLLAACAPRTEIRTTQEIGSVEPMAFELVQGRTSIERFDPPGAGGRLEMTVGAQVRNPNAFGVWFDGVTYSVALEGKTVARGAIAADAYLEPGATVPVSFDLATSLANDPELLGAAVRAFTDRPMRFRIDGTVRFRTATHSYETRNRTLLEGGTLARQTVQAPILRLDEASSRVFMLQEGVPVVQVVLQAANPGDIGYFLHGKDLRLTLGGWPLATEDMRPVPIAANQASRIDILFYPDAGGLPEEGRLVLEAALAGHTTLLRVEGELFMDVLGVDSFPMPAGWSVTGFVHGG